MFTQLSIKYLSFILTEDIGLVVKDLPKGERKVDELDLTFLDHKAAFKSKTTWQVLRAYLVFNLCAIKPLVDNNEAVRKFICWHFALMRCRFEWRGFLVGKTSFTQFTLDGIRTKIVEFERVRLRARPWLNLYTKRAQNGMNNLFSLDGATKMLHKCVRFDGDKSHRWNWRPW